ncbi:serine hydrolase [Actinomycetospora corticicola]|uniref:Beta-lactamase class A catalytic domain-containing protein n=1 Tax=Actinomycetospora corticicola TaxID=663602 RepID=A0A7Y9J3Y5_9PSEU|nr:serine hydrolase [Actinomycetospora corticicola]NYD34480.1 hypothetical protein [Actinomycetospora corticicola]
MLGVLVLVLAACSVPDPPVSGSRRSAPPAPPTAVASPAQGAVDAGDAAVARDDATVGIAVLDRLTGTLATNDAGAFAFHSASLSKLLTTVDAFTGPAEVTESDRQRIVAALGPSDDDAMNALWSRFGGQEGITRVIDALGLQDTAVPDDPSQWGEVRLSPRDVVSVLDFVADGLAPAARDLVLGALAAAPEEGADGFDQAFGLLDPAQRGDARAKQGWLCCLDDRIDLHSAGFPDASERFAVAILSRQPLGYPAARQVLDDVAAAVRGPLA